MSRLLSEVDFVMVFHARNEFKRLQVTPLTYALTWLK
jgi:hypothetical protein